MHNALPSMELTTSVSLHLHHVCFLEKPVHTTNKYYMCLSNMLDSLSGRHLRPVRVVCDFELGIISAVETELPGARLCGYMFHFCQSLYRKINELGLSRAYKQDVQVKSIVCKVMALAVLPLALVRNSFLRISRHHPNMNAFVAYVDNTYFNGRFQPAMRNSYSRNRRTRTNNYVEGINQTYCCKR